MANDSKIFTPPVMPSPASEAAKKFYEKAEKPAPKTPTTDAEAEILIRNAQWEAMARLAGIIGNPKATDSMVVSAAKEISGQLQRFTETATKDKKFPDKIEIILVSPDGKMVIPERQGGENAK